MTRKDAHCHTPAGKCVWASCHTRLQWYLQRIVEAARQAPTLHNMQNCEIVVIDDPGRRVPRDSERRRHTHSPQSRAASAQSDQTGSFTR